MKLAVLGSPISHSKSPALHAAAYRVLGLDWGYESIEMDGAGLRQFVESRDAEWRGLSLTMPLKRDILPLLDYRDDLVTIGGAANTVLFEKGRRRGFNTDIYGISRSFREHGVTTAHSALILGAGATAGNAIVAAAQLGASRVSVLARDALRARDLSPIAHRMGLTLEINTFDAFTFDGIPDAIINTLPNGAEVPLSIPREVQRNSVLLDVSYKPWPTTLAKTWAAAKTISGLEMLLYQALIQVRIFVNRDQDKLLPNEDAVLAAMRAAVAI